MKTNKDIGQRIKIVRLLTGLTRKDFCQKYHLSAHTLLSLETGRLALSEKKAQELIAAFTYETVICTTSWILEGKGNLPYKFQSVIDTQSDSQEIILEEDQNENFSIFEEIEAFKRGLKRAIVTLVNDDGMFPYFKPGDYVGGKLVAQKEIDCLLGEICIVEIEADQYLVRHLRRHQNKFILSGLNPLSKLCSPLLIVPQIKNAAKVIWHRGQE